VIPPTEVCASPVPWPSVVVILMGVRALIAGALAGDLAETAATEASP
jgi:hypothetical protein